MDRSNRAMSETAVVKDNMAKVKSSYLILVSHQSIFVIGFNTQEQGHGSCTKIPGLSATEFSQTSEAEEDSLATLCII